MNTRQKETKMIYQIQYHYTTGDSFHSYDTSDILEVEYKNIETAKEALKRIEEHYKWYEYKNVPSYNKKKKVKRPKWWDCSIEKGWTNMEHHMINLPTDNGKDFQIFAPWCGYFETLHWAEIIVKAGKDTKVYLG
jgi:hypothetical protein